MIPTVGIEKDTNFIAPLLIVLHFIDFKDANAHQIKNKVIMIQLPISWGAIKLFTFGQCAKGREQFYCPFRTCLANLWCNIFPSLIHCDVFL